MDKVELHLEWTPTLNLPLEKISKLRSMCKLTSMAQQVSRADRKGLIGLVTFSYSVVPLGLL